MKTTDNTILITGGSAGIGLELARALAAQNNHVIITGRNEDRLLKAAASISNVTPIVADVTIEEDVEKLAAILKKDFPGLNVVINNAGNAFVGRVHESADTFRNASEEMLTNYLSVLRLNDALLPLLRNAPEAAIVNVTSIVVFAPSANIATYSASKAALHSYTQSLRLTLQDSSVRIFELMPPLVNTDFSQDIGGANGIPPKIVADELLHALEHDIFEIHVAGTADLYGAFLSSPEHALAAMNP